LKKTQDIGIANKAINDILCKQEVNNQANSHSNFSFIKTIYTTE